MQLPTTAQAAAFGRHIVSYSMGFVTALVATHVATPEQGQSATDAIYQISQGVALIVSGGTTLVAFASAVWATISASIRSQIAAVQSHPDVQVTVTNPDLAAGIPGVKVESPK